VVAHASSVVADRTDHNVFPPTPLA
jgi:hypothetical protein